ncbi:hypothetical protein PoB_003505200 [Plakobranchus ocellatus]|uniref:Uncharacterized protein n=1 Tax=Plakobranchus ocellatus TaxID=259542 RepID=A0AAV4ANP8_9GAST|nr:hypothetical protein PoB_003505200 [Plakobranchus ocellatus]
MIHVSVSGSFIACRKRVGFRPRLCRLSSPQPQPHPLLVHSRPTPLGWAKHGAQVPVVGAWQRPRAQCSQQTIRQGSEAPVVRVFATRSVSVSNSIASCGLTLCENTVLET